MIEPNIQYNLQPTALAEGGSLPKKKKGCHEESAWSDVQCYLEDRHDMEVLQSVVVKMIGSREACVAWAMMKVEEEHAKSNIQ
jgi:hypothetical protein